VRKLVRCVIGLGRRGKYAEDKQAEDWLH
jgi:hypothetical protein